MAFPNEEVNEIIEELRAFLDSGNDDRELWKDLIERLISAADRAHIRDDYLKSFAEKIAVTGGKIATLDFPLDKINSEAWRLLERIEPNGQLALYYNEYRGITDGTAYEIDVANPSDRKAKKDVTILYALDFEALDSARITKKLLPYDKLVYIAISALFNSGRPIMSLGQIYNTMGYDGKPNSRDKEKINKSITKMNSAHIYIQNEKEKQAGYNYPDISIDESLLSIRRVQARINGNLTESVIHVLTEPPLMRLARDRKQITTISRSLLCSPLSKTDNNIAIEDYLIERIAHMKKGAKNSKLLYSTIYENTGINDPKQKQRAPEKIRKLLAHYQKEGYIKGFKEDTTGVNIAL